MKRILGCYSSTIDKWVEFNLHNLVQILHTTVDHWHATMFPPLYSIITGCLVLYQSRQNK